MFAAVLRAPSTHQSLDPASHLLLGKMWFAATEHSFTDMAGFGVIFLRFQ